MELRDLKQKIESSKEYQELKSQNKDFNLCVCFLILDFKQKTDLYSLDYKSNKNIFSLSIKDINSENIEVLKQDVLDNTKKLIPFSKDILDINVDISDLFSLVQKEFEKNNINKKIEKIIAILQQTDKGIIWQLTIIAESFLIFLINIDAKTKKTLKFEKKSLFDFAKPVKSL